MKLLQEKIWRYMKARGWDQQMPADVAKSIMIEGAELLELFQWSHPSVLEIKKDKEKLDSLKGELADVLIYALEMAILFDLDAEKLVLAKMSKAKKKYPAKLIKNADKNERGNDSVYWKIKKAYRGK